MDLFSLLLLFMAVELFESNWQKHDNLYGLIYNNYQIYIKNIFLYFILHASFFYAIAVAVYLNNFNFWMSSIIVIKFLDMAFKINMMQKLSSGLEIHEVMPINIKITLFFRYFNVLLYPASFAIANGMIFN
ncbi:MAG: hypothetical protein C0626_06145 [Arcobacter sp.]|uniref:hypothetical protein n=1 Tax=uncultured Arcobacter sp. TaxID=165434 RepID=UPI000CA76BD2|nr:hypothetical protein [uncultured Arcobacter sp.]PLY10545.1 MAG: hypothetical protein C0626_06145 [Arcobacter sp.]